MQQPESLKAAVPWLFRASKDEKQILILGTCHAHTLDVFSPQIQSLLCKPKKLLMERINFSVPEMVKDFIKLPLKIYKRKVAEESRFLKLSSAEQTFIKEKILHHLQFELRQIGEDLANVKDELIFGMIHGIYTQTDGINSMDVQLREEYKKAGKAIVGLEESSDLFSQILHFYARNFAQSTDSLSTVLQTLVQRVGAARKNYLKKDFLCETSSIPVAKRNQNWFYRILQELAEDSNMLLAVGLAHLTEKTAGLLSWFRSQGYAIELADNEGNFRVFSMQVYSAGAEVGIMISQNFFSLPAYEPYQFTGKLEEASDLQLQILVTKNQINPAYIMAIAAEAIKRAQASPEKVWIVHNVIGHCANPELKEEIENRFKQIASYKPY
ncbi:TraB/GumN family protein [Legionella septentrionalis]|uniref:TraB/GumN family protein n=1 Tax=Legionella septentrionalis TaxID=2498109 RepID=UPI000F8C6ED5|nr:TraB/GumN family protein [Legionella septentrionalis]RUR16833.1 hypothetical protein ELY10_02845 [Legionella septentrionalis]